MFILILIEMKFLLVKIYFINLCDRIVINKKFNYFYIKNKMK